MDSIFTKIIKGEIPCYKIYEDERTFAFLDIYPIQPGQVVIVPKRQVPLVWDLPSADYDALMRASRTIAKQLQAAFPKAQRIGLHIEGLDVDHAHVKVFPFSTDKDFHNQPNRTVPVDEAGLQKIADSICSKGIK